MCIALLVLAFPIRAHENTCPPVPLADKGVAMKFAHPLVPGILIQRYKRFLADVTLRAALR